MTQSEWLSWLGAQKSNIEWTEITWNPTIGCSKISEGCRYCYAEKWANMQQKRGLKDYEVGFRFQMMEDRLNQPYAWKKSKIVFVNSMRDFLGVFEKDFSCNEFYSSTHLSIINETN